MDGCRWIVGFMLRHIIGEVFRWPLCMLSGLQIGMDAVVKIIPSRTVKGTVASHFCGFSYPDSWIWLQNTIFFHMKIQRMMQFTFNSFGKFVFFFSLQSSNLDIWFHRVTISKHRRQPLLYVTLTLLTYSFGPTAFWEPWSPLWHMPILLCLLPQHNFNINNICILPTQLVVFVRCSE